MIAMSIKKKIHSSSCRIILIQINSVMLDKFIYLLNYIKNLKTLYPYG